MPFLEDPFFLHALLSGLLASLIGGVMGSYIVVKRMSFLTGSISHSVLGGIGLSLFLDRNGYFPMSTYVGTFLGAIVSALVIGIIHIRFKEREDTIISSVWTVGMALGILLISFTPGYNVELNNFLVGNIVWATKEDLFILSGASLFVLTSVFLLHKKFLSFSFDELFTKLQGVSVQRLYLYLLLLISISIVLLIQSVGVILVMSMLVIPPAIANQYTKNLTHMMFLSAALGMFFTTVGMFLSYHGDLPVGATIALLSSLSYFLSTCFFGLKAH